MKYIVYLTVNNRNGKIYVGVHKTATPYKFDGYYGCGVKQQGKLQTPKFPFQFAFNKYGSKNFSRHTMFVFDTIEEAFEREAEIVTIEFVRNSRTYNVKLGGGSGAGLTSNKEVHCYSSSDGAYIKSYDSLTKAARAVGLKGLNPIVYCLKGLSRTGQGYFWSEEKVSNFIPNVSENKTVVYQYTLIGKFVNRFDSLKEAAESLGKTNTSPISQCLIGARNKAYGFVWEYTKKESLNRVVKSNYKVEIHKYDAETGLFIKSYESAKDATLLMGRSIRGNITSCATGKRKTAGGFKWSYDKLKKIVI